jgi:integrase
MLCDGGGLYCQISPGDGDDDVRKSWLFRFSLPEKVISKGGRQRQRQRWMGLGSVNTVSLSDARTKALELRKLCLEGMDPIEVRRGHKAAAATSKAMTFNDCRDAYVLDHGDKWKNPKHARQWVQSLETHITPVFGKVPVASVDEEHVIKALRQIWRTKPETAKRIRGRVESVLDWARVNRKRTGENPARWRGHLDHVFARRSEIRPVKPMAALPYAEMPVFMAELRAMHHRKRAASIGTLGLEFMILTAARTGEICKAQWDEISSDGVWSIPAEHTKRRREHKIPLSDAALAVLDKLDRTTERIFPVGVLQMLRVIKRLRPNITAHGTARSTFRDWSAECTDTPNEVCEMALGHSVKDATEAAYRRGTMFEKRKLLMQAWADYCSGQTEEVAGGNVIRFAK